MFAADDDSAIASSLHRQATVLKDAGDWDGAIEILRSAKPHMERSGVSYPPDTWDRLPRYLQRVGRYAEAMAEFDYLLSDLPRRANHSFCDDDNVSFGEPKQKLIAEFIAVHRQNIWRRRRLVQMREIERLRRLAKAQAKGTGAYKRKKS